MLTQAAKIWIYYVFVEILAIWLSSNLFSLFIFQRIKALLSNTKVQNTEACRLVALYGLRYERHSNNNFVGLMQALAHRGVSDRHRKVGAYFILRCCCVLPSLPSFHHASISVWADKKTSMFQVACV